jgi:hypothetical protein
VLGTIVAIVVAACGTAATPVPSAAPSPLATPGASRGPSRSSRPSPTPAALRLPPPNAAFDYQLGGAYPPPAGVTVVSRDRTEAPAPGLYAICYINGFQIQPGEEGWWQAHHPALILRGKDGKPVVDPTGTR